MALTLTSLEFVVFLGVCLGLLHGSRTRSIRTWLLVIFSYLFYVTLGVGGVLVVTATAVVDFIVGRRLGIDMREETGRRWLWAGLAINLGPLVFFKSSGAWAGITALLHPLGVPEWVPGSPVLPIIGLSYFTFAGMSYVLDVYYERIEPAQSLLEYVCYLVYFPKLVAGPIVRAGEFLPQLSH